jgi:hypothetical protein
MNTRRLLGHLNYKNLKKGITYSNNILGLTRKILEVGQKSGIKSVEDLSDKIINNEAFNRLEKIGQITRGLTNVIETHRTTGLFNKTDPNLNKNGEDYAIKRRNSLQDERKTAEQIVGNMRPRSFQ